MNFDDEHSLGMSLDDEAALACIEDELTNDEMLAALWYEFSTAMRIMQEWRDGETRFW